MIKNIEKQFVAKFPHPSLKSVWLQLRGIKNTLLPTRKIQVYCIGVPRSGTHSLASMFSQNYKTYHEPGFCELIDILEQEKFFSIKDEKYKNFFHTRDRILHLDVEASHILGPFVKILHDIFPQAKFILLLRDCYSWLDSIINSQLNIRSKEKHLLKKHPLKLYYHERKSLLLDFYFRAHTFKHSKMESILSDNNLHTLDGYLTFWKEYYAYTISAIKEDRLFIVRTCDINTSQSKLARFLEIPPGTIAMSNVHSHKTSRRYNILGAIRRDFLEEKVQLHCASLMKEFFPEITKAEDVLSYLNN